MQIAYAKIIVFVKHPLLKSEGVNWAFAEDLPSALVCKLSLAQIFPQMNEAVDMGREELLLSGKRYLIRLILYRKVFQKCHFVTA